MDLDAIARLAAAPARATTRRAGIAAVIAAALAPSAASARPESVSQCGARKRSSCRKDGDCCSGRCNTAIADTNKDGFGRCRCSRRNDRCGDDKDCCSRRNQGLVCNDGVCGDPCVTLGAACNANSTCCAGSCTRETTATNERAAATCCLPLAASGCLADSHCCGDAVCIGGVCANACLPLQSPCETGDVCCAGVCPLTSNSDRRVQPALAVEVLCCIPGGSAGCTVDRDCCTNLGSYTCEGGTCSQSISDVRLKEQIVPLDGSLAAVEALRPVRWSWTAASGLGERPQIGFIAQEVGQVVPEVVASSGSGYLGIDYAKLVAVLTGAVQEQQAEIASLRERLAALESGGAAPREH